MNSKFRKAPNKKGGKRRRKNRVPQSGNLITRDNPRFPNDIKQIPIHNRAIRYVVAVARNLATVSPQNILRQVVTTVNASTNVTQVYGSVRLRRVSFYYVPSSGDFGGVTNVLSFQWTGLLNSPDNLITDRGTATQPACIKVKPPPDSLASFWYDNNSPSVTSALFTYTAPIGTIIDIDFDFTIGNGTTTSYTISAPAIGTGVAIYQWDSTNVVVDGNVNAVHN
jgi:hypothetical protein